MPLPPVDPAILEQTLLHYELPSLALHYLREARRLRLCDPGDNQDLRVFDGRVAFNSRFRNVICPAFPTANPGELTVS
jgi:hypothetical protein